MSLISSQFPPGDPRAHSLLELLRPGSPPARVITLPTIAILRLQTETSIEGFLTNYVGRAEHLIHKSAIAADAAANTADLGRYRASVATFLKRKRYIDVLSITLNTTASAQDAVPGAGLRIVDLRGQDPTELELAEILADESIVGVALSHRKARPSWKLLLKPDLVRALSAHGYVRLDIRTNAFKRTELFGRREPLEWLREHNHRCRAWVSELEISARLVLRLASIISTMTVALLLVLHAVGFI